jgi:hypothetical protein
VNIVRAMTLFFGSIMAGFLIGCYLDPVHIEIEIFDWFISSMSIFWIGSALAPWKE